MVGFRELRGKIPRTRRRDLYVTFMVLKKAFGKIDNGYVAGGIGLWGRGRRARSLVRTVLKLLQGK